MHFQQTIYEKMRYLARRFTAVQNFLNFVQLTPRCVQTKISPSFWSITAFSGGHRVTLCPPLPLRSLREPRFYPQKYGAFSANSAIVSRSISRKNMSRLRIKQTSTPSGSQPLSLRARHLPLPQGTALMMSAHSRENNIRADACLTPAPKRRKAQSATITDNRRGSILPSPSKR